ANASPLFNAGSNTLNLGTDQRGINRVIGPYADIGAVEASELPSLIVTTSVDVANPFDGLTSLREAMALANTDGVASLITFDPAIFDTVKTINLTAGELTIAADVTITGPTVGVIVDAKGMSRVFHLAVVG